MSAYSDAARRRPLRRRFLAAFTAIGFLASFTASLWMTLAWAGRAQRQRAAALVRISETLQTISFPLSRPVLMQIRGLTDAEFAAVNRDGRLLDSTRAFSQAEWKALSELLSSPDSSPWNSGIVLADGRYRCNLVRLNNPANVGADRAVGLMVLIPEVSWWQEFRQALRPAFLAALVATLLSAATAVWLSRRISLPLQRLAGQTAAAARDPALGVDVPRAHDELRDLALAVDGLLRERRTYELTLRDEERRRSLQQLASGLAHQLRNYATAARMALELHIAECRADSTPEELAVVLRQIRLMENLLRQFLSPEASPAASPGGADLVRTVEETAELSGPAFRHAGVALHLDLPRRQVWLKAGDGAIRQLVSNLLNNALEAARDAAGEKAVCVKLRLDEDAASGRLEVVDSGLGPPESVRDKLFHTTVTTKADGCGLGLLVAARIADRLGGRLVWERRGDQTVFALEFPLTWTGGMEGVGGHGEPLDRG
ncbi:MAG: HAMP domain-containing histidine kinase [Thermogutta sp.]|nr:HAMP domain-containing histidine kinase [Thermogutta sp.]